MLLSEQEEVPMLIFLKVRVEAQGMPLDALWDIWEKEADAAQAAMAALPMAHMLEIEEVLPVREYESFANDLRRRWQPQQA